ncbi:MAG TPA: hypothetical protein PKV16_05035 [Caldisericia bacterium]|nr:hypothetical protein [Caldisericia bacterium]HPF48677.1 hypothetical protein [Caldisericia bacterium]HPI83663.1 hypothetical protein [Caldisericia bacterium]HPQ93132.1 hypothetical protein [Caldisericia bacterium]HRV75035.1 hypothetical protein [Caldisericia bacterium]
MKKIGVIFVCLVLTVSMFAVFSPKSPTLASTAYSEQDICWTHLVEKGEVIGNLICYNKDYFVVETEMESEISPTFPIYNSFMCYSFETGEKMWERPIEPVLDPDKIFVNLSNWVFMDDDAIYTILPHEDDPIHYCTAAAINPKTGNITWTFGKFRKVYLNETTKEYERIGVPFISQLYFIVIERIWEDDYTCVHVKHIIDKKTGESVLSEIVADYSKDEFVGPLVLLHIYDNKFIWSSKGLTHCMDIKDNIIWTKENKDFYGIDDNPSRVKLRFLANYIISFYDQTIRLFNIEDGKVFFEHEFTGDKLYYPRGVAGKYFIFYSINKDENGQGTIHFSTSGSDQFHGFMAFNLESKDVEWEIELEEEDDKYARSFDIVGNTLSVMYLFKDLDSDRCSDIDQTDVVQFDIETGEESGSFSLPHSYYYIKCFSKCILAKKLDRIDLYANDCEDRTIESPVIETAEMLPVPVATTSNIEVTLEELWHKDGKVIQVIGEDKVCLLDRLNNDKVTVVKAEDGSEIWSREIKGIIDYDHLWSYPDCRSPVFFYKITTRILAGLI